MSKVVMGCDDVVLQTIALEASNQSIEAQTMVARVIRARAEQSGLEPQEVVLLKDQFSCWNPSIYKTMKKRTPKEIKMASDAWFLSKTKGTPANLFCETRLLGTEKEPYWVKHPRVRHIIDLDDLSFFWEER